MNERKIYDYLINAGLTHPGACALMGNLEAESGLRSDIAELYYMQRMGYTSQKYTKEVDEGTYVSFVNDSVGYGLAQWTYHTRKESLLKLAKSRGVSISDLDIQLEYLIYELKNDYPRVWNALTDPWDSIKTASDLVMVEFENPADQSETAKQLRVTRGLKFNDMFRMPKTTPAKPTLRENNTGKYVKEMQDTLIKAGYLRSGESDGIFGLITLGALLAFQKKNDLVVDGICGPDTWAKLAKV